ncbi:hypothetical protein HDU76_003245, partial [Blyttiomyces sp. JEL0837]
MVCRRLRILTKTHLHIWLRSRFSDIKNVYTNRIKTEKRIRIYNLNHPDDALTKQLIENSVKTGQSEVLQVLLKNLPVMSVLYQGCINEFLDLATGKLPISKKDHHEIVKVLLQVYIDQRKYLEGLVDSYRIPSMDDIRETIINAVTLGDLELVKIIWNFAYVDYSTMEYAIIPQQLVSTAVEMNRFDIIEFFIKNVRFCYWTPSRSVETPELGTVYYDDNGDRMVGSLSVKPLLDTVLTALCKIGVNKTTAGSFLERYFALGGDLIVAAGLLLVVWANTTDIEDVFDILVSSGFHVGIGDYALIKSWNDLLLKGDFRVLDVVWEYGLLDLVEFGTKILSLEKKGIPQKKNTDSANTIWTMETVIFTA